MKVTTHKSRQTGIITHHEYRGVFLIPYGISIKITKHYWHGAYKSISFKSIKLATQYVDELLDSAENFNYSSCDGFISVAKIIKEKQNVKVG